MMSLFFGAFYQCSGHVKQYYHYSLSKTCARVRHTLSSQPYRSNVLSVLIEISGAYVTQLLIHYRDYIVSVQYVDSGFHRLLENRICRLSIDDVMTYVTI
jgi:hypothetical protein